MKRISGYFIPGTIIEIIHRQIHLGNRQSLIVVQVNLTFSFKYPISAFHNNFPLPAFIRTRGL